MKNIIILLLAILGCLQTMAADTNTNRLDVDRLQAFSFKMMQAVMADGQSMENVVVSPLSVCFVMGMMAQGADGQTRQELEEAMGMTTCEGSRLFHEILTDGLSTDPTVKVNIDNLVAVDGQYTLLPSYRDSVQQLYNAEAWQLDFASMESVKAINDWGYQQTYGMIPRIVETLVSPSLLINAVYFKGGWHNAKFQETIGDQFTNGDGRKVKVQMMTQTGDFNHLQREDYALLCIDYGEQAAYSMVVILPEKGISPRDVLQQMTPRQWQKDLREMHSRRVYIGLPRFEVKTKVSLDDFFSELGIKTHHYNNMTKPACVGLGSAEQIGRIKVNEEGTEAAAVTKFAIGTSDVEESQPVDFYANRPFLFAIVQNKTKLPLFIGEYRGEANAPQMDTSIYKEAPNRKAYIDRPSAIDTNKVYDVVDKMPQFPGGSEALVNYLKENLRYPAAARQSRTEGRVIVQFVVDTDGSITNVKVVKGVSPELNAEAIRIVQSMPKYTPGYKKGTPCKVKYTLPITFKLGRL